MPSDDYASVVRGGLKLKGAAKPAGITKKKKKKKEGKETESQNLAIQKALEDEDAASSSKNERGEPGEMSEEALRELEERGGDGKTATERAHEEMRRKRVSTLHAFICFTICPCVFRF